MTHELTVPLAPEAAFRRFTDGLGEWWPREYTWGPNVLAALVLEPREGGRLLERTTYGNELDFGRVTTWEPPTRVAFTWQISPQRVPEPDPARCGEVEVRFEPVADGTRVALVHAGFERHGEGGEAYRELMDSPAGWPYILECYAATA